MFSSSIAWHDIFDIMLITLLFYNVIILVKQTRAVAAIYGILTLIVGYFVVRLFGLTTLTWMLENILNSLFLLIVIVFQNDIRRGLSFLGTKKWWSSFLRKTSQESSKDCEEICSAAEYMANRKIGALIVIEGRFSLGDTIASGVSMDATLTKELLINCFWPNSPLHDGAVIIRRGKISAAGCILPLSKEETKRDYGTRHRAALGITEETDATVIVVSEERGRISVVEKGRMVSDLSGKALLYEVRSILENF